MEQHKREKKKEHRGEYKREKGREEERGCEGGEGEAGGLASAAAIQCPLNLLQGYHPIFDKCLNEEFGDNGIQLQARPNWQSKAPYFPQAALEALPTIQAATTSRTPNYDDDNLYSTYNHPNYEDYS
ncbi:unnamed protein product [Heligmosomoides polygyrus]|uniref:Uncharacterized protein n=1 Tax=Heligmosomoides polygyrus TaxID=6339 RepID=A0A183FV02_HELPZ|nr:unnamed protein product [Heligmosomoides polygyrus]